MLFFVFSISGSDEYSDEAINQCTVEYGTIQFQTAAIHMYETGRQHWNSAEHHQQQRHADESVAGEYAAKAQRSVLIQ